MQNRRVVWMVVFGMIIYIAGAAASISPDKKVKTGIASVRSEAGEKGLMVVLSHKMPFQLIQVDDRVLLLAVKSGNWDGGLPRVKGDDALVSSLSFDRLPGGIIGLVIHTKKPVVHESTEWNEASGHVVVRLK